MNGLQSIAHVGQRPADDDGHRIIEIRRAHLLLEAARLDVAAADGVDRRHARLLYVQVGHQAGVLLDERAARLDRVTHQHREDPVGLSCVLDRHADERPP